MTACAACNEQVGSVDEAFTGDVCPHCRHFVQPTRLGRYTDLELIRRGGMGAVYRARHPDLGTAVAIKLVHASAGAENLAARFDREARLTARIPHPGVVRVYDADCQDGRLYLVMEFVEGPTLRELAAQGQREIAWSVDVVAQLLDCLHAAHERGIVHRDVKPENIIVDPTGRVRVLDFGISRVLDADRQLTQTGEILGTPEYIAPEQILDVAEAVDARTDVYAAGVVLYELLTGRSPFAGANLFQVLKYVESRTPPRPRELRPELPVALDDVVMAAIAKDKTDRPRDARAFAQRLRSALPLAAGGTTGRRGIPLPIAILALAVAVALGWAAGRSTGAEHDTVRQVDAGRVAAHARDLEQARALLPALLPSTSAAWRAQARSNAADGGAVTRAIAAAVDRGDTTSLAARIDGIDRGEPVRYLLEAALAIRADDLQRLRAACELASVAGAGDAAAAWFVVGRVWLAGSERAELSVDAEHAGELLAVRDALRAVTMPGLATATAILAAVHGDRQRAFATRDGADPALDPLCAQWRGAEHAATSLFGDGDPRDPCRVFRVRPGVDDR